MPLAWFQARRRSTSRDSIAQATTWLTWVGTPDRIRCASCNSFGDPVGHISRNMGYLGCSLFSKFVEEHVQCGLRPAGSGPDETAAVVVDNDDQVAVPPFVGDLIDPDPTQTSEAVDSGLDVIVDPCDDRPDRPPRHPQQLTR